MTWLKRTVRTALIASLTPLALSCGGDDEPTVIPGSIDVIVSPTALSVQQGTTGTVTVTLARLGGFTGAVTLSASGLPAGATASVDPAQLTGSTTTAFVIVTVAAPVAPGTYTVTITASATGVTQTTATYQLTVTPAPNYVLSSNPAALVIRAGSTEVATINIARTSFPDVIGFGMPSPRVGIFGTFSPTPAAGNATLLAVTVDPNVPPGPYVLNVVTNAPPLSHTLVVPLTVTPAPDPTKDVEYQFCDPSNVPVFFAFQNGSGAWQRVTPTLSAGVTRFGFNLNQGRGGVMWVSRTSLPFQGARTSTRMRARQITASRARALWAVTAAPLVDVYETQVLFATTNELTQDGFQNCAASQPTKTVTATVLGVQNSQYGMVSLGDGHAVFVGGITTNPITLDGVPSGPVDLVAARLPQPGQVPNRAIVVRNLNVPDGGSLPSPVDFNAATITPVSATATITGAAGENLEMFTDFVTANSRALFTSELLQTQSTPRTWSGLPQSAMASSDFHGLAVFATPTNGSSNFRVTLKFVGPVSNQTLTLGPAITSPTSTPVAGGAYPRLRFQGSIPVEYDKGIGIGLVGPGDAGNVYEVVATSAFLTAANGSALAYDLTMPDVAGLAGFPAASRLTAGANQLSVDIFGYTGAGIRDLRPSIGTEFKAAVRFTTVGVP